MKTILLTMPPNIHLAPRIGGLALLCSLLLPQARAAEPSNPAFDPDQDQERTCFQTASPYNPKTDIRSDVALVYGFHGNVTNRIEGWRQHGYRIHFMTGVAWGDYQDYFTGKWDGKNHEDESQTDKAGNIIGHGVGIPYVAPSETYGKYLCLGVQKAIDAGAEAVHLEEPEFWVRSGYSESFKREWQSYYKEPWIAPHTSPDAQYRASKLKYFLYRRALQQVFDYVNTQNKEHQRQVRCYVPTHSMINYAQWRIVSPEQSLVQLQGCDGYIGQVWTGTARTPNRYQGVFKERTFETAFFEYGALQNQVRATGRRMYYLNDPVEDNPDHTWADYQRNWECTLVASLLWSDVSHYEVAPWPERPFMGSYPIKEKSERQPGEKEERTPISQGYATELLTVFNALNDMRQPKITWDCGTEGMGILISDTMMFQRGEPNPSDADLGSFYGLALPLLKSGQPVQPVQYENIGLTDYLKPFRVLFLTYEGMKPPTAVLHERLAEWVKKGGILVFVDDDADPYQTVKEWWNTAPMNYSLPRAHLFEKLNLSVDLPEGRHSVGRGTVIYSRRSPAALTKNKAGADQVLALAREACKEAGASWKERNHLVLKRGPYVIGAGLDESPVASVKTIKGHFINLFSPSLDILDSVTLNAGDRVFLYDLDCRTTKRPMLLASAAKITSFKASGHGVRCFATGPQATTAATRLSLPSEPRLVKINGTDATEKQKQWHAATRTLLLEYPNKPEGQWIEVE
jgi:hypothetical protein